jgi:hypothetical protein
MSDVGFGGVDFSFAFNENFQQDLAAYFQTPEGQANLAASGLSGLSGKVSNTSCPTTLSRER